MTKYHHKLRRRLLSGASRQATARWFISCMVHERGIREEDFTPLERAFWHEIKVAYTQWRATRKLH
jgi:hypothetical protein